MSNADYAIRVQEIGKRYRIGVNKNAGMYRYKSLRDSLGSLTSRPWHAMRNAFCREPINETNSFWALKDVGFDVKQGEVLGIVGRNGAGKSTLLKILSRITKPTEGQVELRGRVGSLLEVGTGFHPELSGRENIYLNGAILGMTCAEVKAQFDEIVAFSEIEKFVDMAVKQYSSGMYMRLAFAVAAHLQTEILVVDEVLAVGDAAFQKKCLGKMKDVARDGRTVLFVSHNMAAIEGLCTSGLLLCGGTAVANGAISHVVAEYAKLRRENISGTRATIFQARDGCSLEVESINGVEAGKEDDLELHLKVHLPLPVQRFGVGLHIFAADGYKIARLWPAYCLPEFGARQGTLRLQLIIKSVSRYLASGHYRVDISLHDTHTSTLLHVDDAFELAVPERDVMQSGYPFRFSDSGVVPLRVWGNVVPELTPAI